MQAGTVIRVRTVSTVNFTGAITHGGAAAVENFVAPMGLAAGGHARGRIHEVRLWSVQKLAWALQLFGSAVGVGGAAIDAETFLAEWDFASDGTPGNGSQVTGDTFYYYYINGQDIAYEDSDRAGKIHLRLVNRDSSVDKIAGATGAIVVELAIEPLQGV